MTGEEYVNQVTRLMDLQNTYMGIFLAVLGVVLAVMGFLQWRISDKQIEKIKNDMTNNYKKELDEVTQRTEKDFLLLTEEIVFNSIDSMFHTELRIDYLPLRIARLLELLEGLDTINKDRTSMLIYSVKQTMRRLDDPEEFITDISKVNFDAVLNNLEYILEFIDTKAKINDLLDQDYQGLKKYFSEFKEKHTGSSGKN